MASDGYSSFRITASIDKLSPGIIGRSAALRSRCRYLRSATPCSNGRFFMSVGSAI